MKGANNMSNWISVKDRQPEKSGRYLVYIKTRGGFSDCRTTEYSARHKAFNAFDILEDIRYAFDDVTHWMPLPEPPEEVTG